MPGSCFPVSALRIGVLAALLPVLTGCTTDRPAAHRIADPPLGVSAATAGHFYPLEQGHRWSYAGETTIRIRLNDGSPPSELVLQVDEERVIDGIERRSDRDYLIERQTTIESLDPTPIVSWVRYRQDRTGLYEADVALSEPPVDAGPGPGLATNARPQRSAPSALLTGLSPDLRPYLAAAWGRLEAKRLAATAALGRGRFPARGVVGEGAPSELTRLQYPLHPGQAWDIRLDPPFASRVERQETLDTPAGRFAAWRIRVLPPELGPTDEVVSWYSRCGYLGLRIHIETELADPSGPLGTLTLDQEMVLTGLDIGGTGRCGARTTD